MTDQQLTCATWNVHRARGTDGRVDPHRVVTALGSAIMPHGPDILALQEADGECRPHARILDMDQIAKSTGLIYAHKDPKLRWGPVSDGFLGTILFTHPRFSVTHADVIDLPGHCHRGAIALELAEQARRFRVISTHLSLAQPLRVVQMRIVGQYLRRRPKMQTILLGDLNEWRPWGGFAFANKVVGTRLHGPARRTFPTRRPVLPLDRIMTDAPGHVTRMDVIDTPQTNLASDHRPVVGRVLVPARPTA